MVTFVRLRILICYIYQIEEPKEVPKVVDVVPEKPAAPVKVRNPDSDDDDSENEEVCRITV